MLQFAFDILSDVALAALTVILTVRSHATIWL
jgi:hypothetical protein